MKREKINSDQTNFLGWWKILNDELFLNLINFFEYNKHLQNQGIIGSGKNLIKSISEFTEYGIETLLLTSIKKDGMLEGPDLETLQKVKKDTSIEIQASGGFRSIEDIVKVKKIGIEHIILGRAIHSKIIAIEDAVLQEDN